MQYHDFTSKAAAEEYCQACKDAGYNAYVLTFSEWNHQVRVWGNAG